VASRKKHGLGEGDMNLDKDKLAAALRAEKRKHKGEDEEEEWQRDKRRKQAGSSWGATSTEVTEEELEAYRMARIASTEDPVSLSSILDYTLTNPCIADGELCRRRGLSTPFYWTVYCILLACI
jgi:hypothetical protein